MSLKMMMRAVIYLCHLVVKWAILRQFSGFAAAELTRGSGGNPRRHGELGCEVKVPVDAGEISRHARRQDFDQPCPAKQ